MSEATERLASRALQAAQGPRAMDLGDPEATPEAQDLERWLALKDGDVPEGWDLEGTGIDRWGQPYINLRLPLDDEPDQTAHVRLEPDEGDPDDVWAADVHRDDIEDPDDAWVWGTRGDTLADVLGEL